MVTSFRRGRRSPRAMSVRGQAADHPARDAEGDAPIRRSRGRVHVRCGRGGRRRSRRSDAGRSARAGCACRTAPTAPPARPCAPASCGLRGDARGAGRRPGVPARARSATRAPCPVSSYSRRRGRPSAAAASSQREVSRPNSSSRPRALYSVPWPVSARDPLCSRIVWASPNPWKVACPERRIDSADPEDLGLERQQGSRLAPRHRRKNRKISSHCQPRRAYRLTEHGRAAVLRPVG